MDSRETKTCLDIGHTQKDNIIWMADARVINVDVLLKFDVSESDRSFAIDRCDLVHHYVQSGTGCGSIPNEAIILPWLHNHCLDSMAEVSRCPADVHINRHEVTVTILLVHRLLDELRVIVETL